MIHSDFKLVWFQTAIFTPGLQFVAHRVLHALMGAAGDTLDGKPVVLPRDPDAPPEIPTLVLQSESSEYRVQASSIRFDVFWAAQGPQSTLDMEQHLRWVHMVNEAYLAATKAIVGRMACVAKRAATTENPGMTLARHFCKEQWLRGPLNRPEEFQMHAHKRFLMSGRYNVNSWFRCLTGKLAQDPRVPAVIAEQDLNTLAEEVEQREFGIGDVAEFVRACPPEFDHILRLYFPEAQDER